MTLRRPLIAALLFGAYWFFVRSGCGAWGSLACPPDALEEGVGVRLAAAEVCREGYLCGGQRSFRVERYPLTQGRLRVRVRPPSESAMDDREFAKELQDAAIEGIMAWNNQPFPISITTNLWMPADIEVSWNWNQNYAQAGHLNYRATPSGKGLRYVVDELAITLHPMAGYTLEMLESMPRTLGVDGVTMVVDLKGPNPQAIRAIAMHEMGHALGLKHSDREGDIMFPRMGKDPSRLRISPRDLATVAALYRLPNGAEVE